MTDWHVSDRDLGAWIDGTASPIGAASVEQHLVGCDRCQSAVGEFVQAAPLNAVWYSIRSRIETPRLNLVGRCLARLGMPERNAMLISTAPSLSSAWLTGVVLALAFAVLAANSAGTRGIVIYLLIAPLAPLVGIAAAFGARSDPLFELTVASPYSKFRLLLWRSAAVLATTIPITLMAAIPLHAPWWIGAAWLLPAASLVALALASPGGLDPQSTSTAAAVGWIAVNLLAVRSGQPLAAISPHALVVCAAIGTIATASLIVTGGGESSEWRHS
jgi:Putative zinc-finger